MERTAGKTHGPISEVEGWSERLASDSEAVVKAERESRDRPLKTLQEESVEFLHVRSSIS